MYKKHFRWHNSLRRPVYVIDENDRYYFYIILTHAPWTNGRANFKLTGDQYIRPIICVCDKYMLSFFKLANKFTRADGPRLRRFYKYCGYKNK